MVAVGAGGMARHHIRNLLQQRDTTRFVALCEPSAEQCRPARSKAANRLPCRRRTEYEETQT